MSEALGGYSITESTRSEPGVTPDYASLFYSKKINFTSPRRGDPGVTPQLNSPLEETNPNPRISTPFST